eukprot:CAMPEP_0202453118 /NCGR_PEP_ID=MMETSP1360-20130828/11160_1 /ASSEMBLY_ACC=CAM_ASM_000848 /TAXON_ID=515479 /ORGANISM="Licmophora paradoxa, Strain CCMP2313" /LENGTH=78 /DNA_ID=CAMNT_0049072117 /DNA_START=318 /DNA_END=550 /DNA_ORIENTATION=+
MEFAILILLKGLKVDLLGKGEAINNGGRTSSSPEVGLPETKDDTITTTPKVSICDPRWLFNFPTTDASSSKDSTPNTT